MDNPITRNFAVELASKSLGSYNVGQIAYIYDYIYKNWKYVSDPTGKEYFSKASETIENNLSGDCDDFAILLSSCIEAIGGNTRITFAQNSTGGHAYTEVRISQNEEESKELSQLYSQLTPEEKDLVGLYNNHILRRGSEQFSKPVIKLPNTLEEASKYFS